MMPDLDGFGLLAALRADPALRDVPVILLSARAGEEATLEGLQAGADDYLVKPFSARELLARVESLLLRARVRAVEESHARRLAAVFAQAPVGIAVLRGRTTSSSRRTRAYRALVGGRDVVGKPIREALPELEGQGIYERLDARPRTRRCRYVGRSVRPDGRPRHRRARGIVLRLRLPAASWTRRVPPTRIVVIAYDVTELARARRDAEVANRAKDEFLAMLGHELRNPLAPIPPRCS